MRNTIELKLALSRTIEVKLVVNYLILFPFVVLAHLKESIVYELLVSLFYAMLR
jgi:hypothetical protein